MKIGYARVSTGEQNLEMQIDALREAGCETIFSEKISGAKDDRPKLKRAMDKVSKGGVLVVWKLDRLGRSLPDLIYRVDELGEKGADFVSLQEGFDTGTAAGRLFFHIFGALAEFERDVLRERTKAGLRAARARGRIGGRPPSLDEDGIRMAQRLITDEDLPVKAICDRLGISSSTLYRYVSPTGERRQ